MKKNNDLLKNLDSFFNDYLPNIRQASDKTIKSYGNSLISLFEYINDEKGIKYGNLTFKDLNVTLFDDYLIFLKEKGYSVSTIRCKITAISSFLTYAAKRDIRALSSLNALNGIKLPKAIRSDISYFTKDELKLVLSKPKTLKNRLILALLYDSAARAEELCNVKIGDIRFTEPYKLRILGKGRKIREVPISAEVISLIKAYLAESAIIIKDNKESYLFGGRGYSHITTSHIRHLIDRTLKDCGDVFSKKKYSPHSFRHSKAVHMLEAGVPLIYIRNFLGHESVTTTEIYAKVTQASLDKYLKETKTDVIESVDKTAKADKKYPDFLKK